MRIWPVLLDSDPPYLEGRAANASLLLSTLGVETVLRHVCATVEFVTRSNPILLSHTLRGVAYRDKVIALCPMARLVCGPQEFADVLARFELSDALLGPRVRSNWRR
jgi:hypothetical protein